MNEKIFEKIEKCIFGSKTKTSYLLTETLIVQKLCEGEWSSYLFSALRKISYKLERKLEKVEVF